MPDYNKGDFTQQGIDGFVEGGLHLNEKRCLTAKISTDEDSAGLDSVEINIHDHLNNLDYTITGENLSVGENAIGGGGGKTTIVAEEQTFTAEEDHGMYMTDLTLTNPLPASGSIDVVYDGVLYNIPYNSEYECFGELVLVDDNPTPDFTNYPCVITRTPDTSIGNIVVNNDSTHTIEITYTSTEITITDNGTYDVDGLETAIVNVTKGDTVGTIPLSDPRDEDLTCYQGLNTFTYTYTDWVNLGLGGTLSIADITGVYLNRQSDNTIIVGMSYTLTATTLAITVKIYNNTSATQNVMNAGGIALTYPADAPLVG